MADIGTITVTMGITDAGATKTLGSCEPTAYADATITDWRAGEVMTATNGAALDIFPLSTVVAKCSLIVTNMDAVNDVDLTWDDLDGNSNTQSIEPLETVVVGIDPTVAPTVAGDGGDCLCMIAFMGV